MMVGLSAENTNLFEFQENIFKDFISYLIPILFSYLVPS